MLESKQNMQTVYKDIRAFWYIVAVAVAVALAMPARAVGKDAPVHPGVGGALRALFTSDGQLAPAPQRRELIDTYDLATRGARLLVELRLERADTAAPARVELARRDGALALAWIEPARLPEVASAPGVRLVRDPLKARRAAPPVTSQEVAASGANKLHAQGATGQGVRVAVLDIGFAGHEALVGSELPAGTTHESFLTDDGEPVSSWGTASAELVHDMAPGAELVLVAAGYKVELLGALDWLAGQDVQVIVCAVGHELWEPNDGHGPIATRVNELREQGIAFVTLAGDMGDRHYRASYVDLDGTHHDFGGEHVIRLNAAGGICYHIEAGETIDVSLVWDDWGPDPASPTSDDDYDLRLYYWHESMEDWLYVTSTSGLQLGSQAPTEQLVYTTTHAACYGVAVRQWYDPDPHTFDLFSYIWPLQAELMVPARSVTTPCAAERAICVGAVDEVNAIRMYSSQGPSIPNETTGQEIPKPDLVSLDGVSTLTSGETPYAGTFVSAMHVGGALALSLEMTGGDLDAAEAALKAAVIDLGDPGFDTVYGHGRLHYAGCTEGSCDDGLGCTDDVCDVDGQCVFTPNGVGCLIDGACVADGELSPLDPCQRCDQGAPTAWSPVADGVTCDDGLFCTVGDACQAGACAPSGPRSCTGGDVCAEAVCDDEADACVLAPKPDGTDCPVDDNPCTDDVCTAGVCAHVNKLDGSACADDDLCTVGDTCQAGVCAPGAPLSCDEATGCTEAGVCDPQTGQCVSAAKPDGTPCDDDELWCTDDRCQDGACAHSLAEGCLISGVCYEQWAEKPGAPCRICDEATPDQWSNKLDGTTCDDENPCSFGDSCHSGTCSGSGAVSCDAPPPCHAALGCDPATGECGYEAYPDGITCADDGLSCTNDECQAGSCVHVIVNACVIDEACVAAGKVSADSPCMYCDALNPSGWSPRLDGTFCDDEDPCTDQDVCAEGLCQPGAPLDCAHMEGPCAAGVCDADAGGCVALQAEEGSLCGAALACEDGALMLPDLCDADGACVHGGEQPCAPYAACEDATSCAAGCGADEDCVPPARCLGEACRTNEPPVAVAGPDQLVQEEAQVTLDGRVSFDEDSDALDYAWIQLSGAEVTLDDPSSDTPGFSAPQVGGSEDLVFELTVSDPWEDATPDQVTVRVTDTSNDAPIADAGDDVTTVEGHEVTLYGIGSTDPDGDPLTFLWSQSDGPAVTLDDPGAAITRLVVPVVKGDQTLVFKLVVSDGQANSEPDEVEVLVRDPEGPAPDVVDDGGGGDAGDVQDTGGGWFDAGIHYGSDAGEGVSGASSSCAVGPRGSTSAAGLLLGLLLLLIATRRLEA
jgi:hypothetical protein